MGIIQITFFLGFFLWLQGCTTTGTHAPTTPSVVDQQEAHEVMQIREARALYQQKDYSGVDRILELVNDSTLSDEARVDKYNLWGLALYALNDFAHSSRKFIKAKTFEIKDKMLESQITLNLATCYYKMIQMQAAWGMLNSVNIEVLPANDMTKYFTLYHWIAESQQKISENLYALIHLCDEVQDEKELGKRTCGQKIMSLIESPTPEDQLPLLDKLTVPINFAAFYWGQRIQVKLKRKSLMSMADKVGHWINAYSAKIPYAGTDQFHKRFEFEVDDKITLGKIGVVLPLSGDRLDISQKILNGIRQGLKNIKSPLELVVKDSTNVKNLEKLYKELSLEEGVGMVIGGAFPSTSEQEYQLSSALKMIFFSLAPVSTDVEHKNIDLFEISGSIQSQNSALFKEDVAEKLGKRFVLIYSGDVSGSILSDDIWKRSQENKFILENVSTYSKGMTDYRDSVLELLGLKYSRERLEEYNLWYRLYYYKTKNDLGRVQVLKPKTDFDWVYLPTTPSEAMQIISSFIYAEAKNLTYVGGPQWRSAQLMRTSSQWSSKLYFLDSSRDGDWVKNQGEEILNSLGSIPEYLGFEAMITAASLYQDLSEYSSRRMWLDKLDDLDVLDKSIGVWTKNENYWLKEMKMYSIEKDGKVLPL